MNCTRSALSDERRMEHSKLEKSSRLLTKQHKIIPLASQEETTRCLDGVKPLNPYKLQITKTRDDDKISESTNPSFRFIQRTARIPFIHKRTHFISTFTGLSPSYFGECIIHYIHQVICTSSTRQMEELVIGLPRGEGWNRMVRGDVSQFLPASSFVKHSGGVIRNTLL